MNRHENKRLYKKSPFNKRLLGYVNLGQNRRAISPKQRNNNRPK